MTVLVVLILGGINHQQTMVVEMLATGLHQLVAWLRGLYRPATALLAVHLANNTHALCSDLLFFLLFFLAVEVNGSIHDRVK